jgi:hypothetical protein
MGNANKAERGKAERGMAPGFEARLFAGVTA